MKENELNVWIFTKRSNKQQQQQIINDATFTKNDAKHLKSQNSQQERPIESINQSTTTIDSN